MELSIKNIGKIKEADVSISGITVIAGENNTGKSTVGKVLFSLISSMYRLDQIIAEEKKQAIMNTIIKYEQRIMRVPRFQFIIGEIESTGKLITEKVCNIDASKNEKQITEEIKDILIKYTRNNYKIFEKELDDATQAIYNILKITDSDFIKIKLTKNFNQEFASQINNIFSNEKAEIKLKLNDNTIKIEFTDNEVSAVQTLNLYHDVVYIDSPLILNEWEYVKFLDIGSHRRNLIVRLFLKNETNTYEEILAKENLKTITDMINEIVAGDLIEERQDSGYKLNYKIKGAEKILSVKNLSSGIKIFALLKRLILNGVIRDGETIILDEPEIHLHPEWQLVFAELIVLLQKKLNVHILLTTHSPYFLNAIEVFSKKHGIQDKCNYYIAVNQDHEAILENVNGDLERIYSQLARPLQDLENGEYCYDNE